MPPPRQQAPPGAWAVNPPTAPVGNTCGVALPPEAWLSTFTSELRRLGVAEEDREARSLLAAMPAGYMEETPPEQAARDWLAVRAPDASQVGALEVRPCAPGSPGDFRLRRTGRQRVELSTLVPVLESFGLAVLEAVPWRFVLGEDRPEAYLDDIGVRVSPQAAPSPLEVPSFAGRLVEAVQAVVAGQSEVSRLNRLVVGTSLSWREVDLLAAYCAYRRLAGGPKAAGRAAALGDALTAFPRSAVALVRLFQSRLCASLPAEGMFAAEADVLASLAEVPDLHHYEALQECLALVLATTRSNWGLERGAVALKLAAGQVPFLPAPRPWAEIFVRSPAFEGLHLRFGPIARGGVRWSDRASDLRSEILGLARAQVKKNSLIVPTGAKGGFVLRAEGTEEAEGKRGYTGLVSALLDVTDNLVGGTVVHPGGVPCLDGDDPYLVLAADKGTASFSDLANEVSRQRGYWLGDAFASGGEHGYDHKAIGITARGAWLAVRRHFRALGMDAQADELRVVGVGDMSGDVFGNGLLQSRSVRLIGAFDHRHIFVDPTPRAEASFEERLRLSRLPTSSWADFNLEAASEGALVAPRQAKLVDVTPEAAAALGTQPGPVPPPQLVKALLQAPVDLIFFGGIGTFVRARDEGDLEVDDPANDDIRVSAEQVRARVVAEGANLALTQRARAAYSRRGGRVNTDFVDNAGGVAMSDREVNLKILLGLSVDRGLIVQEQRDALLQEARDAAATAVLADVEGGVVALDLASASVGTDLPVYEALIEELEAGTALDRAVESLPGPEELARRRQAGAGLSRPELAVLISYARSLLARSIEASPLTADPALAEVASVYFPSPVRELCARLVTSHPLFAQLIASRMANEVVKWMGPLWAYEAGSELGRPLWAAAGAYRSASQLLDAEAIGTRVDEMSTSLSLDAELALRATYTTGVGGLARWYLRRGQPSAQEAGVVASDRLAWAALRGDAPEETGGLVSLGAPKELSAETASLLLGQAAGEVGQVARATGRQPAPVVPAWRRVDAGLGLGPLSELLRGWPGAGRWQRWQLHVLADQLADTRVAISARALVAFPGEEGEQAVDRWLAAREQSVARATSLAARLRQAAAGNDIALATVAVAALSAIVD